MFSEKDAECGDSQDFLIAVGRWWTWGLHLFSVSSYSSWWCFVYCSRRAAHFKVQPHLNICLSGCNCGIEKKQQHICGVAWLIFTHWSGNYLRIQDIRNLNVRNDLYVCILVYFNLLSCSQHEQLILPELKPLQVSFTGGSLSSSPPACGLPGVPSFAAQHLRVGLLCKQGQQRGNLPTAAWGSGGRGDSMTWHHRAAPVKGVNYVWSG